MSTTHRDNISGDSMQTFRERFQQSRTHRDTGGFSLMELVIAVSIVMILLVALIGVINQSGEHVADQSTVGSSVEPESDAGSDSIFAESETDDEAVVEETVEAPVEEPAQEADTDQGVNAGVIWMVVGGVILIVVVIAGIMLVWRLAVRNRQIAAERRYAVRQQEHAREQAVAQWNRYTERFKTVQDNIWAAETDWDTIFYYPAINDRSVPETRELYFAYAAAQNENPEPPAILDGTQYVADMPYPAAVIALEHAWEQAWAHAAKVKQSALTLKERQTIRQIMNLLKRTEDGATTDSEKQVAFERINKLLSELTNVTLPKRAAQELEQRRVLALEFEKEKVV